MEVVGLKEVQRVLKAQQTIAAHDLGGNREMITSRGSADELDQTGRFAEREFAILGSQPAVGSTEQHSGSIAAN